MKTKIKKCVAAVCLSVCVVLCFGLGSAFMRDPSEASAASLSNETEVTTSEEDGGIETLVGETIPGTGGGLGGSSTSWADYLEDGAEYTSDGLIYRYDSSYSGLVLVGKESGVTEIKIPYKATVTGTDASGTMAKRISVDAPVTVVEGSAFYGDGEITSVTAGYNASITLESYAMSIGGYAFYDCDSLKSITVGTDVTEIGLLAFSGCNYVTEINFNATKASVVALDLTGDYPFTGCGSLAAGTDITIGSSVTTIPDYLFYDVGPDSSSAAGGALTFSGTNCKTIGGASFAESHFAYVEIPSSVTSVGINAFKYCTAESLYFDANLSDYGEYSKPFGYFGSESGVNITVGKHVTAIPAYCFTDVASSYTGSLGKKYTPGDVTLTFESDSVSHIAAYAFYDCSKLAGATFYDTENWYVSEEEDGVMTARLSSSSLSDESTAASYLRSAYVDCHWYRGDDFKYEKGSDGASYTAVKYVGLGGDVEVPSEYSGKPVTGLGDGLFSGRTDVTSAVIPSSVKVIGTEAFSGCTSLKTLTMEGSSLESVGVDAFYGCSALTKVYADSLSSLFSADYENADANPVAILSANGGTLYIDESKTTEVNEKNSEGLTYVGSYAFANCTIFTGIELPEEVTHIGAHAFEGMPGLSSFSLGSFAGWSAYDEDGSLVKKMTAAELKTDALGYLTSTYLSCVWEREEVLGVAPTIDCSVESGGYTNGDIVIYTTVDQDSAIDYILYVTPDGAEVKVSAMTLTLYAKDLSCGTYVFYAVDENGLESEGYCVTFDDVSPEIYATGSDVWGGYVGNTFSVYAKDENDLSPVTLYYSRDGESWVSCGGDSFSVTPSGDSGNDGRYWFAAMDAAGNKVGAYWIILDTAVPYGEWGFTDDLSLYFSWEAPSYTTWTCTVNGKAYTKGATYRDETTYTAVLTSPTGNMGTVTYRLDHAYEEEYVEATCSQSGYRLYTCVYCGDVVMELDPFSTAGEHTYELYLKEPSCTESGYSEYVCTGCGAATGYSYIAPLGHIGVAGSYIAPTCTSDGYTGTVCSRCGEKLSGEPITRLGHDPVPEYIDATCTEPAKTITTCSRCDDYYVEELSGEALGHDYAVTEYVAPDCESAGYRVFVCGTCRDSYTEDLPALGHSTVTTYVKDENGDTWAYEECSRCGEIVSAENLGSVEETASNGVIEIFRKYRQYMWWILLAFVAIWSIFIGLRWALARNSEEKAKSRSMLANYIIGLFVIAIILVGLPYLVYGIAVLVA